MRLRAPLAALCLVATAGHGQSLDAFGLLVAQQSRPSFAVVGAGARAAGMGGAFTALADDASAVSFNPAGLALLVKPEASIVLDGRRRVEEYDEFFDPTDEGVDRYDGSRAAFSAWSVNFASVTAPFTVADRNLALQLSYHRVIDFHFQGERAFGETSEAGIPIADVRQNIDQDGEVDTLSLAVAYQLTQRLSLGLTVSRWLGDWTFSTLTAETELGDAEEESLRFSQQNRWDGWNATLGLLLRYRYLDVGLSIRSPFDGHYEVDSSLETSFDTPFPSTSSFVGTLRWPLTWTVGLAAKPLDTWFVTLDYAEFDWDDMLIEGLDGGPVNFFDLRPVDASTTTSTEQWRLGTEYTFIVRREIVGLRAGGFIEPRPQLLGTADEESSNRGVTLGLGWKHGPVSVDAAFQRSSSSGPVLEFIDPETVASGRVEAQAEGRAATTENRFYLSLLYQFDSWGDLRRLFHFLFVGPLEDDAPGSGDGT